MHERISDGEEDLRRRVAMVVLDDGKNGCTALLDMVYHIRNETPCPRRPEHTLDPDRDR